MARRSASRRKWFRPLKKLSTTNGRWSQRTPISIICLRGAVSRLTAYARELNPAEGLWSNLKSQELANRCETHVQMVTLAARLGANRVRSQHGLLFGFLRHTGLYI